MNRHIFTIAVWSMLMSTAIGQTIVDYRGLEIQSPDPTGAAGLRLQNNFKTLADRIGPANLTATAAPTVDDDVDEGYYAGSLWYDTVSGVLYWCADNTDGAATWKDLSTAGGAAAISDAAYAASWDEVTTIAPSKNALYDYLSGLSSVYQAADADLTAWAGVTSSANGRSLVSAADYAAMKALLTLGTMADQNADAVAITGGTINGVAIGGATAGTGAFTTLAATGNITLADTTTSDTGIVLKGGSRFLHNFHHPTGNGAVPVGQNTFVGELAGNFTMGSTATSTSHGSYNTGIGYGVLQANTTGNCNTVNGVQALYSNTTGSNNTANGLNALNSSKAGSNGVAFGTDSQRYVNDTAVAWTNYNTSLGYQALRGSTTAANNTGNFNTALGYQSLLVNTTGEYNAALSMYALSSNTTGSFNTASGVSALRYNTTGSNNTANGLNALNSSKAGSNGVAIGKDSQLYANDTETPWTNRNTSVGYQALRGSTTAANNTGNYNTALGYGALLGFASGDHNTAVGYNAGQFIADGVTANTTSDFSVYLGNSTKASADDAQNEIVIGYGAVGKGSNTIVLGNSSITSVHLPNDNQKLTFGAAGADDSYIHFNGTNLQLYDAVTGAKTLAELATDTTYTAGNGIELTGTDFDLDLKLGGGLEIDDTELRLSSLEVPATATDTDDAETIDFSTNLIHKITLDNDTGPCVLSFTDPPAGSRCLLILIQDADGGETVTWPVAETIYWAGGTAFDPDTTAASRAVVTLVFDGTDYYCTGYDYATAP